MRNSDQAKEKSGQTDETITIGSEDKMAEFNIEVGLTVKTCFCGTVYAVPRWVDKNECPMCAFRKYENLSSLYRERGIKIDHLEHVISGLKGSKKRKR